MEQTIYHVDVNSAFLSWEASYRVNILGDSLDLRTIPSVVGGDQGNRHGIVIAKSIPTKAYDIKVGEPLVSARSKCPDLVIVPPNYPMYVDASKALMNLLREYSPNIHQYSIDESFCNMTGTSSLFGSPVAAAELIKERIKTELGFTVNIGISSNKLLAKMASDFKKPDMIHTLFENEIAEKMWPLPVSDLFFVGHSATLRLNTFGINTIGDLAHCDPDWIKSVFKSYGTLIRQFANGDASQMDKFTLNPINKGYDNSTTIAFDICDSATAKAVLLSLCETVGARIRADHAFISVVSISIVDYDFKRSCKQTTLDSSTDITRRIHDSACALFDELWDHTPIRQLGVHTAKASSDCMYQYSLFDPYDQEKEIKLDKAIDEIRSVWGEDSVMRGCFIKTNADGTLSHMAGGLDKARRTGMTKGIN